METLLLSEKLNQLQKQWHDLFPSLDLEKKQQQSFSLKQQMQVDGFWDNASQASAVSQKSAHLEKIIAKILHITDELAIFTELLSEASDTETPMLSEGISQLESEINEIQRHTLFSGAWDEAPVILSIYTGNGGQDAEDFSQILQRMYLRWAENNQFMVNMLAESKSDSGLRSTTFEINSPYVAGLLASEHGTHRLIRQSPFNSKGLRQTSFARVEVLPQVPENEITLDESDIRVDVFRSGGAGGQSVNTTDSAVRLTYLPLGVSVTCQNERSQLQNKASAMKILSARLAKLQAEQHAKTLQELRGNMIENSFGSQIRTYTLHPYKMAKDHRTNYEENNPDKVFDGELQGFIDTFLTWRSRG